MTQVDAFGFFLNFNKSTYDYSEFTNMLVKKGFVRRFPRIGYLVAKGESFVTNKELLEHQTRLIESDPEKISVMNKHSVVSCISINSGKEIVICNHQETPKFQFNSSEILKEVVSVVDVLKDVVGYENLTPGRLLIASSVKAEKRPHLVLANFDIDKLSYFKKIMPDLEIARWENEIYLYSANIERTGGPGPIIEDMKLKVLPKQTIGSKKVWDHIVFTPRPGGYDIIMQYMSDDLDDLINTFKENEILASTMVNELETLDS
jgi:hypothetical protein